MNKKEIENNVNQTVEANTLERINDSLYLTKYQQQVLNDHNISFKDCKSAKELLFLLSDINDDEDFDDLEEVARQIDEYSYYNETRQ